MQKHRFQIKSCLIRDEMVKIACQENTWEDEKAVYRNGQVELLM